MRIFFIITMLWIAGSVQGQVGFKTIVPPKAITAGESFQVQYIIEGGDEVSHFLAPVFTNFRVVTGPNIYYGTGATMNGSKQLRNTVYTLEAIRPGQFVIPGAVATVNGELLRSPDAVITVITAEEAGKRLNREAGMNSEYFLRPGEDPYRKISANLFMKVMVDKMECYTGEAVMATFKLYSRLESKSDIVKNPGFYGFSVEDIITLADKFVSTENISGRVFDVHTIRKVRLYPLRAGTFTIDPMEIRNKVEFSRSAVYRKTEQQIVEGVLNNAGDETHDRLTDVYETDMHTGPVTIRVKPLPIAMKPPDYNGAVGDFTVSVILSDSILSKNQPAYLDFRLSGEGNFIQLDAPFVNWPAGVEGFPPKVLDDPGGARVFRYAFLSGAPGAYDIPPLTFSYFNPDSGRYHTVKTMGKHFRVNNQEGAAQPGFETRIQKKDHTGIWKWILPAIVVVLITGFVFGRQISRKRLSERLEIAAVPEPEISVHDLLAPALVEDHEAFYTTLRKGIYAFFERTYGLSGSRTNKEQIAILLRDQQVKEEVIRGISQVLETCEAGVFTKATLTDDKIELVERTGNLLRACQPGLL